jgi:hypothetical protein
MEAIYMISLLETFGFTSHERHITFAFDVNGSEVEWTLGMALQYYANNNNDTVRENQNSCRWDSHRTSADTDKFSRRNFGMVAKYSSQLTVSMVHRMRDYINEVLARKSNPTNE